MAELSTSEDVMHDSVYKAILASPLGDLLLTGRDDALTRIDLLGAASAPEAESIEEPGDLGATTLESIAAATTRRSEAAVITPPGSEALAEAGRQLADYFAGRRREFTLPLDPRGTPFQLQVWEALRAIPYGTTVSYAEIARRIGRPSTARAVGRSVGQNPLAIVVPCHRVVGANGALTGFAWGLDRKRRLLELEASAGWAAQHERSTAGARADN
jgi:methylated-DNA-[protein]-cysteine S-methyltransferase